jgi:hypothetical protein
MKKIILGAGKLHSAMAELEHFLALEGNVGRKLRRLIDRTLPAQVVLTFNVAEKMEAAATILAVKRELEFYAFDPNVTVSFEGAVGVVLEYKINADMECASVAEVREQIERLYRFLHYCWSLPTVKFMPGYFLDRFVRDLARDNPEWNTRRARQVFDGLLAGNEQVSEVPIAIACLAAEVDERVKGEFEEGIKETAVAA